MLALRHWTMHVCKQVHMHVNTPAVFLECNLVHAGLRLVKEMSCRNEYIMIVIVTHIGVG